MRSLRSLHTLSIPPSNERSEAIGDFVFLKYRARARKAGYFAVALQLKKQGIPLEIARLILL